MRKVVACAILTAAISAVAAVASLSAGHIVPHGTGPAIHALAADSHADAVGAQQKGRYKKEGDNCVWDVADSGPNQCTPQTRGRFKKGANNTCVWDSNETGPDQCTPPAGRWKKDGAHCVWDPKDSGPNQCNPRQPRG